MTARSKPAHGRGKPSHLTPAANQASGLRPPPSAGVRPVVEGAVGSRSPKFSGGSRKTSSRSPASSEGATDARARAEGGSSGFARRGNPPRVSLIDNYDSFTFNLLQRLGELGAEVEVLRNDALTVDELLARKPERLVLSPGPCTPKEAGICVPLVQALCKKGAPRIPLLGVCLGHQSIGAALGATVARAPHPVHGKAERIQHDGRGLFHGVPRELEVGRYHSLIVREETLPATLRVSARSQDGLVMALRHRTLPVFGVQFHPESILTPHGQSLLRNFLEVQ